MTKSLLTFSTIIVRLCPSSPGASSCTWQHSPLRQDYGFYSDKLHLFSSLSSHFPTIFFCGYRILFYFLQYFINLSFHSWGKPAPPVDNLFQFNGLTAHVNVSALFCPHFSSCINCISLNRFFFFCRDVNMTSMNLVWNIILDPKENSVLIFN